MTDLDTLRRGMREQREYDDGDVLLLPEETDLILNALDQRDAEIAELRKTLASIKSDVCPPRPEQRWVSVSERLPEEDGKYLTFHDMQEQNVTFQSTVTWDKDRWLHYLADYITHWSLLPPPPETEGE